MKERWRYEWFWIDKRGKDTKDYFKVRQQLTWRFYFRTIKKWFTPCDKCQAKLDEIWNVGIYADVNFYRKFIETSAIKMCNECGSKVREEVSESEIILGNKDYEPPIELSRKWIDVEEKNVHGVLEPVMEKISKEEYGKHRYVEP